MKLNKHILLANDARMQAEELRAVSETYIDATAKRMMEALAESYEEMARQHTAMSQDLEQ